MREDNKARYRLVKAGEHGKSMFVDIADEHAVEAVRNRFGNHDLCISACYYIAPDPSAPRIDPLRFHIISPNVEQARISTLEACYSLNERLSIPLDCLEIILTGVGDVVGHAAVDGYHADRNNRQTGPIISRDGSDRSGQDKDTAYYCASKNDKSGENGRRNHDIANTGHQGDGKGSIHIAAGNPVNNSSAGDNSQTTGADITGATTTGEIIITVPPVVFGGRPTPLMLAMIYHLARQMTEDGIGNLDIDVYQRDRFVHLPNSINTLTGRYVFPLLIKELLYLDGETIVELARKPKAEDSMAIPRFIPEAAEWFADVKAEFEQEQRRQNELRELIQQKGWGILPCIRRLQWTDLDESTALETCRLIAQWYSFINAVDDEIWYHVLRLARRNAVNDQQRLRAIVTFAVENTIFMACEHPLLKRFCSASRCFMTKLIEECEEPYLFENFLR